MRLIMVSIIVLTLIACDSTSQSPEELSSESSNTLLSSIKSMSSNTPISSSNIHTVQESSFAHTDTFSLFDSTYAQTVSFNSVSYQAYIDIPIPTSFNGPCFWERYPTMQTACPDTDKTCLEYQYKKIIDAGGSPNISCTASTFEIIEGDGESVTIVHPSHEQFEVEYLPLSLEWEAIPGALYDIFLDTTPEIATVVAREESRNIFRLNTLKPATTYFWRVDAITNNSVIRGNIQSLTTVAFVDLPPRVRTYGDTLLEQRDGRIEIVISDPEGEALSMNIKSPFNPSIEKIDSGYAITIPKSQVLYDSMYDIRYTLYDTTGTPHTLTNDIPLCIDLPAQVYAMDTVTIYKGETATIKSSKLKTNNIDVPRDSFDIQEKVYVYNNAHLNSFHINFHELPDFAWKVEYKDPDTKKVIEQGVTIDTENADIGVYSLKYQIQDLMCKPYQTREFEITLVIKDPSAIKYCSTLECDQLIIRNINRNLYGHIEDYSISDNRITQITLSEEHQYIFPLEAFSLTGLKTLRNYHRNNFDIKNIFHLQHFPQLETLSLSVNYIPNEISSIPSLTFLELWGSAFNQSESEGSFDFTTLPNLSTLKLHHSRYDEIPIGIGTISSLTNLTIDGIIEDTDFLETLTHVPQLESLSIRELHSLNGPHGIDTLNHLKSLTIKSLTPIYSDDNDEAYPVLTELWLTNLEAAPIPHKIYSLSTLKNLAIRHTANETLSEDFAQLKNLEKLDISDSTTTNIDIIGSLPNLKKLSLYHMPLDSIPDSFGNLLKLETLYLGSLTDIILNDTLLTLPHLKDIQIPHTQYCHDAYYLRNGSIIHDWKVWKKLISTTIWLCK